MIGSQINLTTKQLGSFDKVLMDGTGGALNTLEHMFGLDIDSSDSCIEIAPALQSENLKHLGSGTLYTVTSSMVGGLQGSVLLMMRSVDFKQLAKALRPVLTLLFLSREHVDLNLPKEQKPAWMKSKASKLVEDNDYHEQMMDALTEMANVFIGIYVKAIFNICKLNTHYSVPEALKDSKQQIIRAVVNSPEGSDRLHLVIENEFYVKNKPIKLWCLISPTRNSFREALEKIESRETYH
jgi:chemotaxis protein CheY-P-specific phosphatase CheC